MGLGRIRGVSMEDHKRIRSEILENVERYYHARFPDAARSCHKKKHSPGSLTEALVGGKREIPRQ